MHTTRRVSSDIQALIIEKSATDLCPILDAQLRSQQLFDETVISLTPAPTLKMGIELLEQKQFDVVLLDLALPDSRGLASLTTLRRKFRNIPVLVFTEAEDRKLAILSIKSGAQDYLIKGHPSSQSIRRCIHYAVERHIVDKAFSRLDELEQREELVAMLVHDLRTPLVGCSRILEQLLSGSCGTLAPMHTELLQMLTKTVRGLQEIITKMLDTYRLESSQEVLQIQPFNLSELLMTICDEVSVLASEKEIALTKTIHPHVMALGDSFAIRRVLENLLSNGLKFTAENGEISVSLKTDNKEIQFEITDTGKGMTREQLQQIYTPFFQCAHRDRTMGFGLGLSICKKLIELQSGNIVCFSEQGRGTTFRITLPAANS